VAEPQPKAATPRPRILVVDDNADLREYVTRLLAPQWDVVLARDGVEALEKIHQEPPGLVLTDIMMPRMSGLALLESIRNEPATARIPVLLLSARAGEDAIVEGLTTRADDYLVKPFSARELLARVRTHLEQARLRQEWANRLEKANRELEAFSYSVSHDLRAPARAMVGYASILEEEYGPKLDAEARRLIGIIRTSGTRMGQLIDDLLAFSRLGTREVARSSFDMTALVRAALEDVQAQNRGREVQLSLRDLPPAYADRAMVGQVWANLLSNAFKFTSRRAVAHIEIGARTDGPTPVYFMHDDGIGFDMQYADKLFGVFQRLHSGDEFEGTGVGLALVKRIVERHGGRVWAEAAVDHGATFYFTLPPTSAEEQPNGAR
jgi:signal transduction histidine kinase